MKGMYRLALFAFLGVAAFAQTDVPPAEKPPADVDQAVRARVNEFYTLLKDQQYRKGESFVSDDTKDYYYEGSKPVVHAFEIIDVQYSNNFTHAKVTTKCTTPLVVPGFPQSEVSLKIPTLWRLENGNWYLYEDSTKMFNLDGLQKKVEAAIAAAPVPGAAVSGMPKEIPQTPAFAMGKMQVDKTDIELTAGAEAQIQISNGSAGRMELELGYPLPGIEAKLDRTAVDHGEKAVLTLKAGKQATGGIFFVRVMPTEEVIKVRVQVK
jgi:hypothetical protein